MSHTNPSGTLTTIRPSVHEIINRTLTTIALVVGILVGGVILWSAIALHAAVEGIGDSLQPSNPSVNEECPGDFDC